MLSNKKQLLTYLAVEAGITLIIILIIVAGIQQKKKTEERMSAAAEVPVIEE